MDGAAIDFDLEKFFTGGSESSIYSQFSASASSGAHQRPNAFPVDTGNHLVNLEVNNKVIVRVQPSEVQISDELNQKLWLALNSSSKLVGKGRLVKG
jgi:hypothetical protein